MSKRKTSALRAPDPRFQQPKRDSMQTFYQSTSRTIDFNQAKPKQPRKKVELIPQSINQEKFILALLDDSTDIVVVSGPAGTGKTYLTMIAAIQALQSGQVERIVLTRPAVGVEDEKHGFLPGDINQKMEPWTRPLLDVLREYYSLSEITYMLTEGIVEIAPLAFCRGRNFKNCWVVLDEAQNATPGQLKMIMTRIGSGSKIVITGDTDQADRSNSQNGLLDLQNKLRSSSIPGLQLCKFDLKDVQRHPIIEHVLRLYS